ncbi:MAG TPA: transcription termination factor NusA [Anaerolineae bacterium]|nr:transcription termination factor NusA [Anaerolineae bacterium]
MKSEFEIAVTQLCSDRNLSPEVVLEAIEAALVSAYKRNFGTSQNVSVTLDRRTGQARVWIKKVVVETVADERLEISLVEARQKHTPDAKVGDFVDIEVKPRNFGRIAAQTAKQVIMQRIREAERDSVYLEYADREGELVNGVVRSIDRRSRSVRLSLGKAEASLPGNEQIPGEDYRFNQRLRVYVVQVARTGQGPQITVSRSHHGLLRRLLELEVPEVLSGIVEIKAIAREAGFRSKVAVSASQPGVDPVGSCVGMRGVRIQHIVNQLNGEKIDVVAWSPSAETFIANALSPAKVVAVYLNEYDKTAKVVVPDRSLSLAIGKEGQNARLAAKLSGWRIDIKGEVEAAQEAEQLAAEAREAELKAKELEAARQAAAELLAQAWASLEEDEYSRILEGESLSMVAEAQATTEGTAQEIGQEQPVAQAVAVWDRASEEVPVVAEEGPQAEAIDAEPGADAEMPGEFGEEAFVAEPELAEETAPADDDLAGGWPEEEFEDDEEIEETGEGRPKKGRKGGDRRRILEYDERLGRVVSRRKRKPGRQTLWEDEEDWG